MTNTNMTARDQLADRIALILDPDALDPVAQEVALAVADAVIGMVLPLEWEDFGARGAKATAWRKANYLITRWSDGRFELVESYPGYQGDNLSGGFLPTLEAAKAAAEAHHRAQILAALGLDAGEGRT